MESAKHLIVNLTRREETIYNVAEFIIKFQIDHLVDEIHEPKSLTAKDVAAALKLHASTISRVVSNKYVQIDNRVFPLKSFLSKGIKNLNGDTTAKAAIKKRIGLLIKNEDKLCPLSDDEIRKCLEKGGVTVKRRTVAKYRNALRISPAYLRKKFDA